MRIGIVCFFLMSQRPALAQGGWSWIFCAWPQAHGAHQLGSGHCAEMQQRTRLCSDEAAGGDQDRQGQTPVLAIRSMEKTSLPCGLSKGKKEVDHSSSQGSPVVHSPTDAFPSADTTCNIYHHITVKAHSIFPHGPPSA